MSTPRIKYGDPERDNLRSSSNELKELKRLSAWQDVKEHFREVSEEHQKALQRRGVDQRKADFCRGALAVIDDLINEEENILDMLIEFAEELEQQNNGR